MCFQWTVLAFTETLLISLIVMGFVDCIQSRHASGLRKDDDQYFQLDSESNTYSYGYEVSPDGNFHHEHRDQNGVTYGCYGYIDFKGKLFVTHFVADRKGYRVVEPNKPLNVYLTDRISWQAFLLPRGCGRSSSVVSNRPRPELIYKPSGAVSTTTSTTRRPSTSKPMDTTTHKPAPVCSCSQSTTTKKPSTSDVLTPKPPSTTTMRSTTVSTTTPTTTTVRTSQATTTFSTAGATEASTTPTPTTPHPAKPIIPTIIDIDADVNLLSPHQYVRQPSVSSFSESPTNSTAPAFYYVPYRYHLTPPPCVPSTAPPGSCNSHYGFIGLAPVVFVPIGVAKSLGLPADADGSDGIPLRMFAKDSGGNLSVTEMLDDGGEVIKLDYSSVLHGIVNGGDFESLKWGS